MALKISRILHAGYVFESGLATVAFDPIFETPFSRNCFPFPAVQFDETQIRGQKFDAVFISHFHDDHFSLESLDLIARDTPIYFFCVFDELFEMIRALGFQSVHKLVLGEKIQVADIEVTPWPSLDVEVDSLFQIRSNEVNVLNVVDSWIDPETLERLCAQGRWDLVLWPFQTMRELEVIAPWLPTNASEFPAEWREQFTKLRPANVVASSCQFRHEEWSWYNRALFPMSYRRFAKEVEGILPDTKVIRLDPGQAIDIEGSRIVTSQALPWVTPLSSADVDYEFDLSCPAPPTSEIATKFSALTAEQMKRVYDYCEIELPRVYRTLDEPDGSIFRREFSWRLIIYNADGSMKAFDFRVNRHHLTPTELHDPIWITEAIGTKVLSALEQGESLTSMYSRILDPHGELARSEVDIVEDPLFRCLFNQKVGAYQAEQLKRLLARS